MPTYPPEAERLQARVLPRWLWLLALLQLCPAAALADGEVKRKKGGFREAGDMLTCTVGFREMFTPALRRQLKSGFPTTVVMRIYVFEQKTNRTVAFSARTLKAYYDLWEENYTIRLEEPRRSRRVKKRRQKAVVDRLTSLWRFPIATRRQIKPGKHYFVAIIAEVNPISESLLSEVRRWLRNPSGHRQRMGGQSVFGSFVSIFVNNKIRRAEKTFQLRTQPFYRRP